jgi:signal transduction histidine kinase
VSTRTGAIDGWLWRVFITVVSAGSAAAIMVVLSRAVVTGPLTANTSTKTLVTMAAVVVAIGGALCVWILARVRVRWHADGAAAAVTLVCLLGSVIVGWQGGPTGLRSAGGVVGRLIVAALLEPISRRALARRWPAVAAAIAIGATSLAVYAVQDPFHDPDCWTDCSLEDVAPWQSRPAAESLALALGALMAVVAAACWGLVVLWAIRAGQDRTQLLDLALCISAAIAATGFAGISLLSDHPSQSNAATLGAGGLACAGLVLAALPLVDLRRRRRLRLLALSLGEAPAPGTLGPVLARSLGDREVRVAYWLPETASYVDADGAAVPDADRWTVRLEREDEPLAAIHLGRPDRDPGELEAMIGSTARLAIDSERVQAGIRSQLAELHASRQRIVSAADDTRRRVERSLHDVVQAELLGALYELARARANAERGGEQAAAAELNAMADGVGRLIASIRDFARGVYPAVLDASGLTAALEALADEAPVVLTVKSGLESRPPAEVERAVYLLVHDAVGRASGDLAVSLVPIDRDMLIRIEAYRGPIPAHLADRVGALGGVARWDGADLEAVLPCE